MVVETRYAAGDGVLLGSGDHWVLVTDPGDDDVLEELWALVSAARPAAGSMTEQVLAVLEKCFDGDPPALAVVDLSAGGSSSVSRGRGHVHVVGADRILSLDGGTDPRELVPTRRLVAGVVAASRAEVRPLSQRVAPPPAPGEQAPVATPVLIDGIPAAILAATGPEGPPPARPRPRPAPVSAMEDTGSLHDTSEPDPGFMERGVLAAVNYMDTDLAPSELYRLAQAVTAITPGKLKGCVVQGPTGNAGGASVVFPNVGQARRIGNDARRDATVNNGC